MNTQQLRRGLLVLATAGLTTAGATWLHAAGHLESERKEKEHAYEMEEIMVEGHKGDRNKGIDPLIKKTLNGSATDAEKKKLLAYYLALEEYEAPKGDQEEWKKRTSMLTMAMIDFMAGKEGASDRLDKAKNCKACHDAHKPD